MDFTNEIKKRRTFAIISHPDAGKTTLTEKFLLYGGAINTAGSVKGKATAKHAVSDWMEIEKERGISVTSSVLQFGYGGYCINILDTPGHQDFSEDTYRTLMAADSAVMVIDGSKGVEAQTRKLFKVCVMRHIPIFTFINKMDRDAMDTFELLDDIEKELGIATCPINWPIGSGKAFQGVYERKTKTVELFSDTQKGTRVGEVQRIAASDGQLEQVIGDRAKEKLEEEIGRDRPGAGIEARTLPGIFRLRPDQFRGGDFFASFFNDDDTAAAEDVRPWANRPDGRGGFFGFRVQDSSQHEQGAP